MDVLVLVDEESMVVDEITRGVDVVMLVMIKSEVVGLLKAIVVSPMVILDMGTSVLILAMLVMLVAMVAVERIGTSVAILVLPRLETLLLRLVLIVGDLSEVLWVV